MEAAWWTGIGGHHGTHTTKRPTKIRMGKVVEMNWNGGCNEEANLHMDCTPYFGSFAASATLGPSPF